MYFILSGVLGYEIAWADRDVRSLFTLGALSTAFFVIVMYIGVLPSKHKLTKRLKSIRAELSVIACIMAIGHNMMYAEWFVQFFSDPFNMRGYYFFACLASLIIIALMIPLLISSFYFVRKWMKAKTWKRLQKWSYVFYVGLYVHVLGLYVYAAFSMGRSGDMEAIIGYTVFFVPYFILRPAKYLFDRHKAKHSGIAPSEDTDGGCET
ncbi:MAG: ferric reductase-like transmembrane domain-containing protein [Candidatus Methanoplasma sp.]|jgi:DMSO/TMAO reductase YedYZ heme-binding membrane subunit|nr:ferric reductase-like transmembrane domain-containing protein [Candidatus Methanoplasma sp.]